MKVVIKTCLLMFFSLFMISAQAADTTLRNFEKILDSGELRVGVSYFHPWVMKDKKGQLFGAEIDMAKRVAKDMNINADFRVYEWEALIPALLKGEIDVIMSGMAITPARALKVNFSTSYGATGVSMAANKAMTKDFKTLDDMKSADVTLALVSGTLSAEVAKRTFPKAQYLMFATEAQADKALLKGDAHAFVTSNPTPKFLALRYPNEIDVPLAKPLMSFREGFAVRKGDADLLNFLNAWVVSRQADAWIPSTRRYWFETLRWQEQ